MPTHDEVDYVSGRTRVFGIVGHPIEQVRSPEMFTAEFRRRGRDAILVPMHVLPDAFDAVLPQLLKMQNLGGLVFTIPYKARTAAGRQKSSTDRVALRRSGGGRFPSRPSA
jgi:shikimate dehydrogenase